MKPQSPITGPGMLVPRYICISERDNDRIRREYIHVKRVGRDIPTQHWHGRAGERMIKVRASDMNLARTVQCEHGDAGGPYHQHDL